MSSADQIQSEGVSSIYQRAFQKENLHDSHQEFDECNNKISQLIAKSWLPNDPEAARIKAVLLEGNSLEIKTLLKKYNIPVLDSYEYVIDGNGFYDNVDEANGIISIHYPPRPMEVADVQLTKWVNNNDSNTVESTTPYIVMLCVCC